MPRKNSRQGSQSQNPLNSNLAAQRQEAEAQDTEATEPDPRPESAEPAKEPDTEEAPEAVAEPAETADSEQGAATEPAAQPGNVVEKLEAMQREMAELRRQQREAEEKLVSDEDNLYFIAIPRGKQWSERKVVDKQYVDVQFNMTAWLGPFETAEQVDQYIAAKRAGRDPGRWAGVEVVRGDEKRQRQRKERREAEAAGAQEIPV